MEIKIKSKTKLQLNGPYNLWNPAVDLTYKREEGKMHEEVRPIWEVVKMSGSEEYDCLDDIIGWFNSQR